MSAPNLQELKRQVGLTPFSHRLHLSSDGYSPCPFHSGDGEKSFHVKQKDDGAYIGMCFSTCGKSFDAIAFVEKFDHLQTGEAIRKIAASISEGGDAPSMIPYKAKPSPMTAEVWAKSGREVTDADVTKLSASRPNSKTPCAATLNQMGFKIGEKYGQDFLVAPYRMGDTFYTLKARNLLTKDFIQENSVSQQSLFNIDAVTEGCDVYVVESELDAAVLHEAGHIAVSVNNAKQKSIDPGVLKKLLTAYRIFLVGDQDEAGQICMNNIASLLPAEKVYRMAISDAKDVGELAVTFKKNDIILGDFKEQWSELRNDMLDARKKQTAETFVESGTSPTLPAEAPQDRKDDVATAAKSAAAPGFVIAPVSGTADQVTPKKIVWLWQDRIAQKLNMIVGNPDLGKGLITYYVTACITTGRKWFDATNTIPASEVLIMSGEEDWDDTIVPRLMAAGAELTKVHWLKMSVSSNGTVSERELQLDRDAATLEAFLVEHPDIRLVIVDPISNYLGSAKMIDEQKVRADVLTPLKEIANRRQVAVIGVMHLNKKVELDAIHRIGGAMAFVGVARMVWLVAPKLNEDGSESGEFVMVKVKGNIVNRQLKGLSFATKVRYIPIEGEDVAIPYVDWTGEVDQRADELMGKPQQPAKPAHRPAEQLPSCVNWLRGYLKDGAQTLDDIEDAGKALHGFSKATILRAREGSGIITFDSGKQKSRDGKMRTHYSCKLSASAMAQVAEDELNFAG